MILLFSHKLTDGQINDAKTSLNCSNFVYLPENLQQIWSNVDPENDDEKGLDQIKEFVSRLADENDYILIQGEFGYTYNMVLFAKECQYIPVYSTTKREAKEDIIDGKVIKTLTFKHVKFRKY